MTTKKRWIYTLFDLNQDPSKLLSLLKLEYGDSAPTHTDYFKWYCLDNPAGTALIPIVQERETGNIIGEYWVTPLNARVQGKDYTGSTFINILVHPEFRTGLIALKMINNGEKHMKSQGFDMSVGFPNPRMARFAENFPKWFHIGYQDIMIYPTNWEFIQHTSLGRYPILQKGISRIANPIWSIWSNIKINKYKNHDLEIREIDQFDSSFDELWLRVMDKYPIMHKRDKKFLNWRYVNHPRRKYLKLAIYEQNQILGYGLSRVAKIKKFNAGHIIDFIVEPTDRGTKAGKILLTNLVKRLRDKVDVIIALGPPKGQERGILRSIGFINVPLRYQPLPVPHFVRILSEDLSEEFVKKIENWFIQFGDFDVV